MWWESGRRVKHALCYEKVHWATCSRLLPTDWKRRLGINLGAPDLQWSLVQLRRFGFVPKSALDVGAFHGDWTRVCLDVFPEATITCIEPQNSCQEYLRTLASQRRNVHIVQTLLGESESEAVPFTEMGPGSSVLSGGGKVASFAPMSTVDALIRGGQCEPPELIKLDVQGYEIHVLEGWKKSFDRCQVIQIEISLLPIVSGAPLLDEVITYLEKGASLCLTLKSWFIPPRMVPFGRSMPFFVV